MFVPNYQDFEPPEPQHQPTIIIYALHENARPVGFAPWPKPKKAKKNPRLRRVKGK